ncbi:MAG TPA: 50S ribosomal protein L31 [Candidatus Paceibacterota bacterium]|nr:50S ribosomal protein L31 [Candidatus Paceibacterota bacterium]
MKADIHPQYFPNATITCACGVVYTLGSTKEKMEVEICAACHPLYTGNEKVLDSAGRVERFKARQSGAKTKTDSKKTAKATKSKK